jgi:tungstate transport system substrate-binding protein
MHVLVRLIIVLALLPPIASATGERLRLATTTSTENTGLLAALNAPFEQRYNAQVDVIAVGSGKALQLAENGDVDLVLAHAPAAELQFVAAGHGIERLPVMHNDFVIVGPAADPAGIRAAAGSAEAMSKIRDAAATFISRGDESGTHLKELELWRVAGIEPVGEWYLEVGQGMGAVLQMSDDKQAYALTDRGTFLAYRDQVALVVLFGGAPELMNPYHVILVNPERHPHVKADLARAYVEYIRGTEGQRIIREFTANGEPLFFADVIPAEN